MRTDVVMYGVDVSHWNGELDFKSLKNNGFDFVMLKLGGEEGTPGVFKVDSRFIKNYQKAKEAGMHVGAYFYMSDRGDVITRTARSIVCTIDDYIHKYDLKFDMPIAIDVEGKKKATKQQITDYVSEWCNLMEAFGYYVTIYGSDISTFKELLDIDRLTAFDKWVARYGKKPEYVTSYGMWQYDSTEIDKNKCYIDYPGIIRRRGLNFLVEESEQDASLRNLVKTIREALENLIKEIDKNDNK